LYLSRDGADKFLGSLHGLPGFPLIHTGHSIVRFMADSQEVREDPAEVGGVLLPPLDQLAHKLRLNAIMPPQGIRRWHDDPGLDQGSNRRVKTGVIVTPNTTVVAPMRQLWGAVTRSEAANNVWNSCTFPYWLYPCASIS
jgi:hypothetical protein